MPRNNPVKFIKALRKAADTLERKPSRYCWAKPSACNCGVVAQTLLNISVSKLHDQLEEYAETQGYFELFGAWANESKHFCGATLLPIQDIFTSLLEAGFMISDFPHLERLSNPRICARAGLEKSNYRDDERYYGNVKNVIRYLRAWADILCEAQCTLSKKESNAAK